MKKLIVPNFEPKTDIEEYYNDNFGGFNIFHINQVGWLPNLSKIEPLEFLNLFYEKIELIKANKKSPITLANHLISLELDSNVLKYLIGELSHFIASVLVSEKYGNKYDGQLMVCKRRIDKQYYKMFPIKEEDRIDLHDYTFDFDKIKADVNKIDDIKEKIKFLTIKKTEFLQKYGDLERNGRFITLLTTYDTHFLRKCDLELDMLKELSKLNDIENPKSSNKADEFEDRIEVTSKEEEIYNEAIEKLKSIWLAEPKLSVEDFIQKGIDKGLWNKNFKITTTKGSLYGTGKTMLGSIFIAFKGRAISENSDYKEVGKVFCEVFNIVIKESTKEKYKAFSSGNPKIISEIKRTFGV